MPNTQSSRNRKIRILAYIGMLGAMGVLLTLFRFPLIPMASFLEMEFADVPILIGGLAYGVPAALALTVIVSVLQGLLVSPQSGAYGIIMHAIATGALSMVAAGVYRLLSRRSASKPNKFRLRTAAALGLGAASMVAAMFAANLIVTPVFLSPSDLTAGRAMVWGLMPWIVLFNVCKAGINGVLVWLVYRYLPLNHDKPTPMR